MLDLYTIKPLLDKGINSLNHAPDDMTVTFQDNTYIFSRYTANNTVLIIIGSILCAIAVITLYDFICFSESLVNLLEPLVMSSIGALLLCIAYQVRHDRTDIRLSLNSMQIVVVNFGNESIYTIPSNQPIIFSSKIKTYQERVSNDSTRTVTKQRRVIEITNVNDCSSPYVFTESDEILDWYEMFFNQINILFFGYGPQDIAQYTNNDPMPLNDDVSNGYRAYNKEKYDHATLNISDTAEDITPILYNMPTFDDDRYIPVPSEHIALSGHYHNLTKIGGGAQGSMFRALDENNQPVGIKVYNFLNFQSWKDEELFEREVKTLKSLHFKGIPKYIELIDRNPIYYLVESYIPAPSMAKRIKNGERITFENALLLLTNIAEVLNYLESLTPPVIHRDIKPDNLLIDDEYNVWLVDFGVVAASNQKTNAMTFAGTAGYMAPEQITGKVTPAADIYSAGISMLAYLTGKTPTEMKMTNLSIDVKAELPAHIPAWFKQLLLDMTEPAPEKRISNAASIVAIIQDHMTSSYSTENDKGYHTPYSNPNQSSYSQYI